jgi:rare lipoprotein A
MKGIVLNPKLNLSNLQAIFVATTSTNDATRFKSIVMTEFDTLFRKWFSCVARVTLVGVLAISGCTSKDSGDYSSGQSKPIPQESSRSPSTPVHKQVGEASWYGPGFHGQETANGETFDQKDLTAAHPTLPMGTTAKVTNLENGKKVEVRINDRGPFTQDRAIDLSSAAANKLGMKKDGTVQVKIETKPTNKKHSVKQTRKKRAVKKVTAAD